MADGFSDDDDDDDEIHSGEQDLRNLPLPRRALFAKLPRLLAIEPDLNVDLPFSTFLPMIESFPTL